MRPIAPTPQELGAMSDEQLLDLLSRGGGADATANMQWQTVGAGKAKDRDERALCRTRTP